MIKKIVIANRGEIALRILRTCKEMNIKTVSVYSTIDRELKHVLLSDESICIGPPRAENSYLNIPAIISAAEVTRSNAIHPGYGFLSENSNFSEQVEKSGFIFIGPNSKTIKMMGNKISAIKIMKKFGIPCLPNNISKINKNEKENLKIAEKIGYSLIIKSAHGGGGKAIKIVHSKKDLKKYIKIVKEESKRFFNNRTIYIEKYLDSAKHIEIQIISDGKGNAVFLGDRECTIQRNHQKILEEAPSSIEESEKVEIAELCKTVCVEIGYKGLGTFEFLYQDKKFFFIEMNTRIQVEHPVTEMITGIDLVKEQIKIASGKKLSFKQNSIRFFGHSIECRINAEKPNNFQPSPGKITRFHAPGGLGIRWDSHIYTNYSVPIFYDSLIGKLISFGENRKVAIARMQNALSELVIENIETNINLQMKILRNKNFKNGRISTNFLNSEFLEKINKIT
ncbi:acetyl-CoA carboxylase biotin carboxylase subunit [bacterium endosymbiont of Pedicinus badii]|uniref:acetyl-CoA carboxylase biotin carboxylase subunit n=1 Tax=bacterium endosymbiont of Pedicinus badii TaxID=1719126 RepID=UPI0009BB9F8C|nr:acetyl-CoA carboxylase biotin carboxylase subunit [bacterium endosymbiont of Pedicinus badii]OQM34034.1 acetyl-CoA carboxylase biotin carboxylase subunit [bacterium endosymbiont of Pedicinus badii]